MRRPPLGLVLWVAGILVMLVVMLERGGPPPVTEFREKWLQCPNGDLVNVAMMAAPWPLTPEEAAEVCGTDALDLEEEENGT